MKNCARSRRLIKNHGYETRSTQKISDVFTGIEMNEKERREIERERKDGKSGRSAKRVKQPI